MTGTGELPITLEDVEAARRRTAGRVRVTPVLEPGPVHMPVAASGGDEMRVVLKLESLQVTGSFKPRGAIAKVASLPPDQVERGFVTASGGNHGLAVAYAARATGSRAVVYLPVSTPEAKRDRIRAWGAEVVVEGEVWDDANAAARRRAERDGLAYAHPFADPAVIAGQGTLGLEILDQVRDVATVVVAVGGGGLIAGVASAIKARRPGVAVVGVEPVGAPTLYESTKAGRVVTLDRVDTAAGTLAPRRSMPINLAIVAASVDRIALVSDDEMREAARWLWFECGVAAELSGAAAVAAVAAGRVERPAGGPIVAIVCGAGTDGL